MNTLAQAAAALLIVTVIGAALGVAAWLDIRESKLNSGQKEE